MKHSEIKEILNHMSIEEKVVQLCGVSGMDIVHLLENGTFSKKRKVRGGGPFLFAGCGHRNFRVYCMGNRLTGQKAGNSLDKER